MQKTLTIIFMSTRLIFFATTLALFTEMQANAEEPKLDDVTAKQILERTQSAPEKKKKKNGFGTGARKEMVNDPEMKEMTRQQRRSVIESTYGDLVKELALTPEHEEAFINALLDNQIKRAGLIMDSIFGIYGEGGTKSDSDREAGAQTIAEHIKQQEEQLKQQIKQQEEQLKQQIKQLLGEEKFSKYQEYTKTIPDRMFIDEFRLELTNTGAPLQDSQAKALMKIMFEESAKTPNLDEDEAAAMQNLLKDPYASLSDDAISKMFQSRREANQRVLNQAGSFLSAEQLKVLASFYEKQIAPLEGAMKLQQELRQELGNFGKKLQKLQ